MSRKFLVILLTLILVFVLVTPALAITYGQPDGNDHPYVGAIVLEVAGEGLFQHCSGTLISEKVFLTAAHCTVGLDNFLQSYPGSRVLVTFDPTISEAGTFYTGEWHYHPNFVWNRGKYGVSDLHDVGVIVLDEAPPGITPARLPAAGLLEQLKASGALKTTRFTAVGYGAVRETNRTGFQAIDPDNLDRNRSEQGFLSLTGSLLTLSMNLATGNAGTCYGDSGGPHFIHLDGVETDIVAAITDIGDAPCKATDRTYRMDSQTARDFLGQFVELP